jgi:hypothetical protein
LIAAAARSSPPRRDLDAAPHERVRGHLQNRDINSAQQVANEMETDCREQSHRPLGIPWRQADAGRQAAANAQRKGHKQSADAAVADPFIAP